LFAVPWESFKHRHDAADDEHTLVLTVDEATLKDSPGFDESKWPDFADAKFRDQVDKYYRGFRGPADNEAGVRVDTGRVDVDVDIDRTAGSRRESTLHDDLVYRASEITGMTVINTTGKELGSINDLVVDMDTGKVRYAALSYGGFLGLGDKLFAVPWNAFTCKYNDSEDEHQLVVTIDETTLSKAPGFDQDNWPNLADPKFGTDIDKYYGESLRQNTNTNQLDRR
jgi:sporulation protein YlmC with PRC-barrel domain